LELITQAILMNPKSIIVILHMKELSFNSFQSTISLIYTHAVVQQGTPLLDISIILHDWCNYDPYVELFFENSIIYCLHDDIGRIPSVQQYKSFNFTRTEGRVSSNDLAPRRHQHVAVGGTFDHLHIGHKILLTMALYVTETRLVVGVNNSLSLRKKRGLQVMESVSTRISTVENFLKLIKRGVVFEVDAIDDVYGPTKDDSLLSAIVGSEETRDGCFAVNKLRRENGLDELEIYIIDLVGDSSGKVISSTCIRLWILDQNLRFSFYLFFFIFY